MLLAKARESRACAAAFQLVHGRLARLCIPEIRDALLNTRPRAMAQSIDALRQQWTAAGQGHCLQYADELRRRRTDATTGPIKSSIDPAKASAMYKRAKNPPPDKAGPPAPLDTNQIERLATAPPAKRQDGAKPASTPVAAARSPSYC